VTRALLAGLALLLAWPPAAGRPRASRVTAAESTVVVLLGTGMPRPDPAASGPATAVVVEGGADSAVRRVFLFDAGPGVERQLRAAGLPINGVTALFLTHLHSDHTLGYPDLIFTSWVMGRRTPMRVYGPPGTSKMTGHLLAAWDEDIHIRTEGLEHAAPGGWRVTVSEVRPGVVYDSAGVRVTAFPVDHGSWRYAFGYRIDAAGRAVVISGDTRPSESLVRAAAGADVLVHEVYPESRLRPEARPGGSAWPSYMRSFHTSDRELGALAARISPPPRLLILSHLVRMGADDQELLAGVRAGGFTGQAVVGHDLARY
jgi:ribonuclease BN (tRNA processing enzyme)